MNKRPPKKSFRDQGSTKPRLHMRMLSRVRTGQEIKPKEISMSRPETGRMQFGDNWTGIFIRGDHALQHALWLKTALQKFVPQDSMESRVCEGLLKTLSAVQSDEDKQTLREYSECKSE